MLRPKHFGFNNETKFTNTFQNKVNEDEDFIKNIAKYEFDSMVNQLKENNISVDVFEDSETILPDAVFINNWISIFPEGQLVIYPMLAKNRRMEKRRDIIDRIIEKYDITEFIDLSHYEEEDKFLEGTGSVVFDFKNKLAFACKSSRTNEDVFNDLCNRIGYKGFIFNSVDLLGKPIYHTNVMMTIFDKVVIICSKSIENALERNMILSALKNTGRTIIDLSFTQLNQFIANSFEVINSDGESIIIMSRTAYYNLDEIQLKKLNSFSKILPVNISIIERIGGASARSLLTGVNC